MRLLRYSVIAWTVFRWSRWGPPSEASDALRRIRDRMLSLRDDLVQLDNEDDAYIIFETLNSRGKDLEVVDLSRIISSRDSGLRTRS